jgi:integrase
MPKLDKRLTETMARGLRGPETEGELKSTFVVHWCKDTPGFGVRVTKTGDRAYISERRVDGKTVRRTLGKAAGAGAISIATARAQQIVVSSELQTGVDRVAVKRVERKTEKQEGVTLAAALAEYATGKRRKSGLGLKDRTKHDYMAMARAGGVGSRGKPFADGILFPLASKSIYKITAADIRGVYTPAEAVSKRRADYAMQVLSACLNWHGVNVAESPLSRTTAGKSRIIMAATAGDPKPIQPEKLKAWWAAAGAHAGEAGADALRLLLLTGCRPGEILRTRFEPGLLVRDVDLDGGRLTLLDTKNRKTHIVVLSTQAAAIVKVHCIGKAPEANVFVAPDFRETLGAINAAAGVVGITPHKLRHTFASVAEELVSGYALKRMINHANSGDVTGNNYVGKSENQLRVAWQTVADFITNTA